MRAPRTSGEANRRPRVLAVLGAVALFGGVVWLTAISRDEPRVARKAGPQAREGANRASPGAGAPETRGASDRRLVRVSTDAAHGVTVWRYAGAAGSGADPEPGPWVIDLTDEERGVLRDHSIDDLGRLTAEADHALVTATDAERPEAQRRYDMLLNLGAKVLVDRAPAPRPEVIQRQQEFLRVLPAERQKLDRLPPAERDARLDAFKEKFFRDVLAQAEETREP